MTSLDTRTAEPASSHGGSSTSAPLVSLPVESIASPDGQLGATRAALTVGEGDDRVRVVVEARGGRVHVELTAATDGLAQAAQAERPALDRALGSHGLTLGTLSAHADGRGQSSTSHEQRRDDAPIPEARPAPPSPSTTTARGARAVI